MRILSLPALLIGGLLVSLSPSLPVRAAEPSTVSFEAADGLTVFAEFYPTSEDKSSPLVILYHQAKASGRAEYASIVPRLNQEGFHALAVDQRSGGTYFEGTNRTVEKNGNQEVGYCEAYPDLEAALAWAEAEGYDGPRFVWGSSYSAALVFQLGANHPKEITGVLGFSPASGPPLAECLPEPHLENLSVPALAFRPEKEMEYESVQDQAKVFLAAGVPYHEAKGGVHGSSMLDPARSKGDTEAVWTTVLAFLRKHSKTTRHKTLSSGGWQLESDFSLPPSQDPLPAVLLLHAAAGNRSDYESLAEELAAQGIASLRVDLRGHGESTNLGTFAVDGEYHRTILEGTEKDVQQALAYLRGLAEIDDSRLGVVGASYSGERMALAGVNHGFVRAYVALSPGDFSDASIEAIDPSGAHWLFIRATEEFAFFDDLFEAIERGSQKAEIRILNGKAHATELLDLHPPLGEEITRWFAARL